MYGKILLKCDLVVLTGMHIGGSSTFSAIGAVDKPVVRDARTGLPIVPGSSLKGKLRTLLARSLSRDIENMPVYDKDDPAIRRLFGSAEPPVAARLQFSDCFIRNEEEFSAVGVTEVKFENAINRQNAVANPRQIERVNPGVCFGMNIVYEVRDSKTLLDDITLLAKGFRLLQLDYLGGHGSRGSGRVSFRNFRFTPIDTAADISALEELFAEVENYELFAV